MSDTALVKLFEHNNWANQRIIAVCYALSDTLLDAAPQSATKGTIRRTLTHLVQAQRRYLQTLTLPQAARSDSDLAFEDLQASARASGEALLALVQDPSAHPMPELLETRDGLAVEAWVLFVQIINHATEHREQINSMLTALGQTPVDMDGWSFAEAAGAIKKISP